MRVCSSSFVSVIMDDCFNSGRSNIVIITLSTIYANSTDKRPNCLKPIVMRQSVFTFEHKVFYIWTKKENYQFCTNLNLFDGAQKITQVPIVITSYVCTSCNIKGIEQIFRHTYFILKLTIYSDYGKDMIWPKPKRKKYIRKIPIKLWKYKFEWLGIFISFMHWVITQKFTLKNIC